MVKRHLVKSYHREDGTPVRTHQRGKGTNKTTNTRKVADYFEPEDVDMKKLTQEKENVEIAISKAKATLDLVCEEIDERLDALEQQLDADLRKTTYKWVV